MSMKHVPVFPSKYYGPMCGNVSLTGIISLFVHRLCSSCPQWGVCALSGWGQCWPLLFINSNIDWEQESISAASHPWTADNGMWLKTINNNWGKSPQRRWNVLQLRLRQYMSNNVQMALVCLKAILVNYVHTVAFCMHKCVLHECVSWK